MPNDLTTTTARQVNTEAQWSAPVLPEKLNSLVEAIKQTDEHLLPVLTDVDAAAARDAIVVYGQMPASSSPRLVNRLMTTLALAYPPSKMSDDEAELQISVYQSALADVPKDLLTAAFRMATGKFRYFPSVFELRELAMAQPMGPHRWRRHVLLKLVAKYEADQCDPVSDPAEPALAVTVPSLRAPAPEPAGLQAYLDLGLPPDEAERAVRDHMEQLKRPQAA